jgi:2'-5' RNA ligase
MKSYQIVAIIPPEFVCERIGDLMSDLNIKYKTSKSLNYEPHITLKSMGLVEDDASKEISEIVKGIAEKTEPFIIEARGFRTYGSSADKPGIYINIRGKGLNRLHQRLVKRLGQFSDKDRSEKENENFNPHLTIVGNDVEKKRLKDIEKLTAPYYRFPVDNVFLITRNEKSSHESSYEPFHLNASNKTKMLFGHSQSMFYSRRHFI